MYDSIWHKAIFSYYSLFLFIKGFLVFGTRQKTRGKELIISYITFFMLIVMTLAMIVPASLLILDKRTYNLGIIPSIASAAYTTYSITISLLNMKKVKSIDNFVIKEISLVNIINTFMSILILQNTLILANGGYTEDLVKLSIVSSAFFILLTIILETLNFVSLVKQNKFIEQ